MATTDNVSTGTSPEFTSASNAIDQMISMSTHDYPDATTSTNEQTTSDQLNGGIWRNVGPRSVC